MLGKDVLYMLDSDWEPKVPTKETIQKQGQQFPHKSFGSVRLSLGMVSCVPKSLKRKFI